MAVDEPTFIRNAWYVGAWSHDLALASVTGCTIIGEVVALVRRSDGTLDAMEDRCPHRHAPLSLGRVDGENLRCMYHGLQFNRAGQCVGVPSVDEIPEIRPVRIYPVIERDGWIWIWMGDPDKADQALIPSAWGLNTVAQMQSGWLDYSANYELVNDNLCDLSHVDFVHEQTLSAASGGGWSDDRFRMKPGKRLIEFDRWFTNVQLGDGRHSVLTDRWVRYRYHAPGIFIMESHIFPVGTAQKCGFGQPAEGDRLSVQYEQQAVTPIDGERTRYFFATGATGLNDQQRAGIFEIVSAAFAEDKRMIEAQQQIWNRTDPSQEKAFIPQDRGPAAMRRLIASLVRAEQDTPAAD